MSHQTFKSRSDVPIRLTSERLAHILENHQEMMSYVFELEVIIRDPDYIIEGKQQERISLREYKNYYLVVIYKEDQNTKDGFIITAFKTTNIQYYSRKNILWKKI
ncbi:hypothetical protein CO051_01050 [Candidatus Roizmanbacteria bacterium CG_4_9_14_0_2_um_filter_39_13]|uniref:Phage-Barnase-EndoU-ColicinE5/D-RelE like nuclease 2 domain-containing protein n=2 Tax=Candidatus Roizmaniibacteriota TaxID=1752723 RepID=A0A2M8F3A6_9BACT|nr:MAG: hypothetical protein COY15_00365 [Candidatus Roizmanbacteria bacterium CG_4_10_14_0_2_um_filter_39_12]PJC33775.1 MAG: hypothetical protein CO051_01050 [Candidatus Roizmanbacteria bacterium CG_4_9_14_0_2_um_filter_39_13]PJE61840.1 MAG: hypothetical protein COU87_02500 [Candidatus Roizmanbacteria bacterium CG10_big_fil_rev_8_21_14_0_10_39_12]